MNSSYTGVTGRFRPATVGKYALLVSALLIAPTAPADNHRVLWRHRLDGYSLGRRVDVGPDGTLYASNTNRLYAYSPAGELLWTVEGAGGGRPVTFGADGTIYTGGNLVTAINPNGTVRWRFANPRPGLDLAAGPNMGPDGNIYAAQDTDDDPDALGVFSLDPDGNLRWATRMEYPMIRLRGPSYADIKFHRDRMYVTIYRRTRPPPTVRTYDYDGDLLWFSSDLGLRLGSSPALHPNGSLIFNWAQVGLQSLTSDGDIEWTSRHPDGASLLVGPDIAADGTIYAADWLGTDWWAVEPNGDTLWFGPSTGEMVLSFASTPDQAQLVAGGTDDFGQPGWVRGYDANANGAFLWSVELPSENGLNQFTGTIGTFSTDSQTAYFGTSFPGDANYGYLYAVDISLDLDCDGDGILDIDDNCVCVFNPDQIDRDNDGIGDACDPFIMPDNCEDALELCPGMVEGDTIGATNDGTSSCNNFPRNNKDVWYSYTPQTDGRVTVDGCGSRFSFYLSVHTGCPGTVANQITCDFDSCSGLWPRVSFDAVAGQTYLIRVTGFSAVEIEYNLTLTGPPCQSGGMTGDLNCDGKVNAFDIEPFLVALFDPDNYPVQYPDCDINNADVNGDGSINAFDIEPFLELLFGP